MNKFVLGSLLLLAVGVRPLLAEEPRTLPPAIYGQMKKGNKLGKLWISPKYDTSKGFVVGKVDSLAEGIYANTVDYFPYALSRLVMPESTNVLSLTVVDLKTIERASAGYYGADMTVEGRVVDKDGELLMAFQTREELFTRETVAANCQAVIDKIVWSLSRDLGKPFARALQIKAEMVQGHNPSGLVPPPPPRPLEGPLDVKGRLMRLDDLLKKGLITPEEYKAHKEDILKGL
jgi:hypothetical protein